MKKRSVPMFIAESLYAERVKLQEETNKQKKELIAKSLRIDELENVILDGYEKENKVSELFTLGEIHKMRGRKVTRSLLGAWAKRFIIRTSDMLNCIEV